MKLEDIIRMAREAGFTPQRDEWVLTEMLERFAALVAEAEREAILSKATKARDVYAKCAIVLVDDITARSTP